MIDLKLGNCLEIMSTMKDKSVDLILCDPPYGVNLEYNTYEDTPENWFLLMQDFIPEAKRVAKMAIMPSCQIKRLEWIYNNFPPDWLISWYKGSTGAAAYIGFNDWEPHLVYGKIDGLYMHDHFQARNNEKMGNYGHPCPKPLSWATWFITKATKKGMTVLDPFMGSGTTGVASKYFKIAEDRINKTELPSKLDNYF